MHPAITRKGIDAFSINLMTVKESLDKAELFVPHAAAR